MTLEILIFIALIGIAFAIGFSVGVIYVAGQTVGEIDE